jgi:hypothetical protein
MKAEAGGLFDAREDADGREWLKREWDAVACPRPFIRAVIRTYERLRKEGRNPGSEILFGNNEPYFSEHALPEIRAAWAQDTGRDPLQFPWSTWFAVYSWVAWRKTVKEMKGRVLCRLGLDELLGGLADSQTEE